MVPANEESLPFVTCLCPTYRRPHLLENAIATYLAQDYPTDRRELLILEDAGEIPEQSGSGWQLHSEATRFPNLPAKFNTLVQQAQGSVLCIWEDDDIYLPWHITSHVFGLQGASLLAWCKHPEAYTIVQGQFKREPSKGRLHAQTVFTRRLWEVCQGWPDTKARNFDLQFLARLERDGQYRTPQTAPLGDPFRQPAAPSYVFRWESTGHYHGQGYMTGPESDGSWYDQIPLVAPPQPQERLTPRFDQETLRVYAALGINVASLPGELTGAKQLPGSGEFSGELRGDEPASEPASEPAISAV